MSDQPNEQKPEDQSAARTRRFASLHPFALLGYLLGALSLIGLADDLNLVVLYGKLEVWFTAYNRLVTLLFGWIDLWWIQMTPAESHIAILSLLLLSAYFRASRRFEGIGRDSADESFSFMMTLMLVLFTVFTLAPMLLMPALIGTIAGSLLGLILVIYMVSGYFWWGAKNEVEDRDAQEVCRELAVVGAIAALVIVLNYAVFRTIENG